MHWMKFEFTIEKNEIQIDEKGIENLFEYDVEKKNFQ